MERQAIDDPPVARRLHSDDDHATLRWLVALFTLPVVRLPIGWPLPLWDGELELRPITASPVFFAAADFIDDPRLQHRNFPTYRYGLQHRGPAVKLLGRIKQPCARSGCLRALLAGILHLPARVGATRPVTAMSRCCRSAPQSFPAGCNNPGFTLRGVGDDHGALLIGCPSRGSVADALAVPAARQ